MSKRYQLSLQSESGEKTVHLSGAEAASVCLSDLLRERPGTDDVAQGMGRGVGYEPPLIHARRQDVAAAATADEDLASPVAGALEQENLGAADLELTPDDLRAIEAAAARIPVQGARYPESQQKLVDR